MLLTQRAMVDHILRDQGAGYVEHVLRHMHYDFGAAILEQFPPVKLPQEENGIYALRGADVYEQRLHVMTEDEYVQLRAQCREAGHAQGWREGMEAGKRSVRSLLKEALGL